MRGELLSSEVEGLASAHAPRARLEREDSEPVPFPAEAEGVAIDEIVGCNLLALQALLHGVDLIPKPRGLLELQAGGGASHLSLERLQELAACPRGKADGSTPPVGLNLGDARGRLQPISWARPRAPLERRVRTSW